MKKKILSLVICLVLVLTAFSGLQTKEVSASQEVKVASVIAQDMTLEYPGDFQTSDNPNQNRIYFSLSADLKAGQYVSFTMNSPIPITGSYSFVYDCNGTNGFKFGGWVGENPGIYRFSVQIPEDTDWLDIVMYTELGVPKGTPITMSDITVSDVCGDFSGTGWGYFEFGVADSPVPFTAHTGDVISFDLDVINGSIPNRGGHSTCIWVWQNGDISKLLHGNVYTTADGQQRVEVCATEDITSLYFSIDVQNVPTGERTTAIVSNLQVSDWHDDGRMVNFNLTPYEKCVVEGNNYYYTVPAGTDITALAPTFNIASDASVDRASGSVQDFTNPVTYTVTSCQNRPSTYTIYVYALDRIPATDQTAVQAITDRADALPETIAAVDTALLQEAIQLKADYEALTILQKMLVDEAVKDKIMQMAQKAEDATQPIRITCVGDSITQGVGADDQAIQSYPAQLQQILGDGYEVFNAGVSGARVRENSSLPYTGTARYGEGLAFNPNIVIIMLGTNDAYGDYSENAGLLMAEFERDYKSIVEAYQALDTNPKIFIALPPTCYETTGGRTSNLKAYLNPLLAIYAESNGLELIDMFSFTANHADWFPDALHPTSTAYTQIAKEFAKYVQAYGEAALASLTVRGVEVTDFKQETYTYEVGVPRGTGMPEITAKATQQDAGVVVTTESTTLPAEFTITVTSGDGHARNVYVVRASEVPFETIKKQIEDSISGLEASNSTTADDIMTLVNSAIEGSDITATWSVPFAKTEASAGTDGKITGQISLSATGEIEQKITLDLTIPKLGGEGQQGDNPIGGNQEELNQGGESLQGGSVATGDSNRILPYVVVMMIGIAGIMITAFTNRKRKEIKGGN